MNNNTNSNRIQSNLSPDESKAALGLITRLSEQLMPKVAPEAQPEQIEAPQVAETAPESKPELEERVGEVEKKLDMEEYMADMETRIDEKLESFKDEILKAMNKDANDK